VTLARVPAAGQGAVATAPSPSRVRTARRGPAAAVLAALGLLAIAAAGYGVGVATRSGDKDVAAAQRSAEQRAYTTARRQSAALGRLDGIRAGESAGTAAGLRAARRAGGAAPAPAARPKPAAAPGGVKDCPKTPIRKKSFISSVRGITCAAAAGEQRKALSAGHPTRTASGFTCQRIDAQHYRCTKGTKAYRWNITP
jgi:pyruvate/2-oxoglutarate dehydrogenase complex dihydrolipoamide acyltransferase (E2) component